MPTLNINGRKVTVDESFLSLTPEQQNATVEEIAASFQPEQAKKASGRHLSYEEGLAELQKEEMDSVSGKIGSGLGGIVEGTMIAGPALMGLLKRGAAGIGSLIDGESYEENLKQADQAYQTAKEVNPGINTAGQIVGAVGSTIPLGATSTGARALGITGPTLGGRVLASGASNAALSAADTAARGGSVNEVAGSGAIGAGIGAAVPVLGSVLSAGGRALNERVQPLVGAITNPTKEANRRVGVALQRDLAAGRQGLLSNTDEAVARGANVPVLNVDRGGETTRALARSVANQSPEARQTIEAMASDRFATQGKRAIDVVKSLAGGQVDDIGFQEGLKLRAQAANRPAYEAAYKAPQAQQVFTPRIQQLMQSPTFQEAVKEVPRRSADRGAVLGQKAVQSPFSVNQAGDFVLKRRADGSIVTPTLEFWDHVQRNLRTRYDLAKRAGDATTASEVDALRKALNNELDTIVPAFGAARKGAAAFFGAEDALEAGRKFANTPKLVPEARKAFQAMKPAEKEAFATGYASELVDKIRSTGDRVNVINSTFKNQSARDSIELVFGPRKAKELEAYVRVEDIVDKIRGSLGNSTTARQLVELGLGAGVGAGGGYYLTGDMQGAALGAALGAARGTARFAGQRADAKVMEQMAKILTSPNRGNLAIAVRQAAAQPAYMKALKQLGMALAVPARVGGTMAAGALAAQPQ